jgi:hypothetical protein
MYAFEIRSREERNAGLPVMRRERMGELVVCRLLFIWDLVLPSRWVPVPVRVPVRKEVNNGKFEDRPLFMHVVRVPLARVACDTRTSYHDDG